MKKDLLNDAIEISKEIEAKLKRDSERNRIKYEKKIEKLQGIIKRYKIKIKEHYIPFFHYNKEKYKWQKGVMNLLYKGDKLEKENRLLKRLYWRFNPSIELKKQKGDDLVK